MINRLSVLFCYANCSDTDVNVRAQGEAVQPIVPFFWFAGDDLSSDTPSCSVFFYKPKYQLHVWRNLTITKPGDQKRSIMIGHFKSKVSLCNSSYAKGLLFEWKTKFPIKRQEISAALNFILRDVEPTHRVLPTSESVFVQSSVQTESAITKEFVQQNVQTQKTTVIEACMQTDDIPICADKLTQTDFHVKKIFVVNPKNHQSCSR